MTHYKHGNFIRFEIHNRKYFIKHLCQSIITIKEITFPFFLPFEMYNYLRQILENP